MPVVAIAPVPDADDVATIEAGNSFIFAEPSAFSTLLMALPTGVASGAVAVGSGAVVVAVSVAAGSVVCGGVGSAAGGVGGGVNTGAGAGVLVVVVLPEASLAAAMTHLHRELFVSTFAGESRG